MYANQMPCQLSVVACSSSLRCYLSLHLIALSVLLGFSPARVMAQETSDGDQTLAESVPFEFSYLIGEANLSCWHQMNDLEKEPGPQGPHVDAFESSGAFDRTLITQVFLVPIESAEKILWANGADYRFGAPNLLIIQMRTPIDVEELKKSQGFDSDFDVYETFEIKPFGGGRLARLVSPNRVVIASNQSNMDAFLEFQKQPITSRKSAATVFSDPNFILRYAQRKPPGQEDAELSEEMIRNDPVAKLLAPLDRTLDRLMFQAKLTDEHSLSLELTGTFTSAEAAKDASIKYRMGKAMLDQFFELYLEDTELPPTAYPVAYKNWPHAVSVLNQLLENAQASVDGDQCVIQTNCDRELYDTLLTIIKRLPEHTARIDDQFRLQRLLAALSRYHAIHDHYPSSIIVDEESGHVRSWRVEMLKYLGDEKYKELYEKYRKDEPWDSEANLKLLDASVSIFSSNWETDLHAASFFLVLGEGTALHDEEATRQQIKDALGETAILVSADRNIPWTMPVDLNLEQALDLEKLGIWGDDRILVGTANYRAVVLPTDFSLENWRNMLLKADGKKVPLPEPFRPIKRANP